ncbi:hypothetical protein H6G80_28445 [Nostoc sp. FACHB-87]|uniref:hypothetical protein n=1 Tax=Nostocaceae TaxID=1162 RepID=UPI001685ACCF|nr:MULTISPECIES: hypothetical protein [Nostocaceae]MBD2457982.1 hypothetical protein [Nostoc sp. FACHB-87]MBD2479241.1 hypothetical protein [Anabaena sp. FACHB-83]
MKNKQPTPHHQFKGVNWNIQYNAWEAVINDRHLGFFNSDLEAALHYDYHARKANLTTNFPWRAVPMPRPKSRLPRVQQKSEYLGVQNSYGRWSAYYKGLYLGTFKTEEEAAIHRDKYVIKKEGARSKNLSLTYAESALAPTPNPTSRKRSPYGKFISLKKNRYQVSVNGKYLGLFCGLEESIRVRDEYCRKHYLNTERY